MRGLEVFYHVPISKLGRLHDGRVGDIRPEFAVHYGAALVLYEVKLLVHVLASGYRRVMHLSDSLIEESVFNCRPLIFRRDISSKLVNQAGILTSNLIFDTTSQCRPSQWRRFVLGIYKLSMRLHDSIVQGPCTALQYIMCSYDFVGHLVYW